MIQLIAEKTGWSYHYILHRMNWINIRMTVASVRPLDLQAGDHFDWLGVRYTLPDEPDCKQAEGVYSYTLAFYAPCHRLGCLLHKDEGSLTFPYDSDLAGHIDALYTSIGREASGFTVGIEEGIAAAGEFRHIEFDKTYCLDALTRICEAFGTEWHISGQAIRVGRYKTSPAGLFRYGRGKGLYSLEKIGVSDASVVTRLYGYGSSDNLPAGYRNRNLVFSGVGGASCLEKNTGRYGVREAAVTFDDIYPRLAGATVSAVAVPDDIAKAGSWTVTVELSPDSGDLALAPEQEARIKFTSGALTGEAFAITRFDATSGLLAFNTSDDNGYKLPSEARQPAVGDRFVLLGFVMPQSYVDRAEAELKTRTQEELDRRCVKRYAYRLDIDPRYVRRKGIVVRVGDTVLVQESDDSDPVEIRVSEVSYPLQHPGKLSLVLSDTPVYTFYSEKIENDIKDVTHDVDNVYREARAFSRRAWRDAEELAAMLETLRADLLLVGNHAGQFAVGSTFTVNKSNDVNLFGSTAGTLRHAVYKGATDGVWSLPQANIVLTPGSPCYLYAKCSRTAGDGHYCVLEQRAEVGQEEGWYYFPVGVISSPFEGARVFNTTYGFTQVAGGSITAGKIQDAARRLVIDLDNGTVAGPVQFTAGSRGLDQIEGWADVVQDIRKAQAAGDKGIQDAAGAQAAASAAQAVTGNFTQVQGGLQLTTLIKMLLGGVETGGLAANLDNILLWGGGTYAQALRNQASVLLRHDGSGYLAKGLIHWSTSGDLKIDDGAKIGDIDVYNGNLRWNMSGRSISLGNAAVVESGDVSVAKFEVPGGNDNVAVRIGGNLSFSRGAIEGLAFRTAVTYNDYTVRPGDVYVVCANTAGMITVTLPSQPTEGRVLYVRRYGGHDVKLKPAFGHTITRNQSVTETTVTAAIGDTAMLVFCGKTWLYHFMGR